MVQPVLLEKVMIMVHSMHFKKIQITEGFTDQQASKFLSKIEFSFSVDNMKHISNNNLYLLNLINKNHVIHIISI